MGERADTPSLLYFSTSALQKNTIQNTRKTSENFVIFSEIMLDKCLKGCYTDLARVGGICGFSKTINSAHCDDAGDCGIAGNFRGVCPVIGRLNCLSALAYIAAP